MPVHSLNLAKRPFLDTRPVNVVAAVLGAAALVLTVMSVATVRRTAGEADDARAGSERLRADLTRIEARRRASEAEIARHDVFELSGGARNANALLRLKEFSWTRFLSRLERVLPADQRIVTISLQRPKDADADAVSDDAFALQLGIVTREPDGMVDAIRAFYGSPYFDRPVPVSEQSPEAGKGDLWRIALSVTYRDRGGVR